MTTPITILHSRSELLTLLRSYLGSSSVTDNQLIAALNTTLSSYGNHASSAHCYDITIACGCAQLLPCCGLDDIEVWFTDCNNCEVRLYDWDIRCGQLYIPQTDLTGFGRIIAYTSSPQQPLNEVRLLQKFAAGDTQLVISSDLDILPSAGWIKVCESWYEYKCWSRVTIEPDRIEIANIDGVVSDIDPTTLHTVDYCGVATILSLVSPHCTNLANESHDINSLVEFGVSTTSKASLDFIVAKTLSDVFTMLAMTCSSDERTSFYFSMAERQDKKAIEARKRSHSRKPIRIRVKAFVTGSGNERRGFADDLHYYNRRVY